jgi:hypothetical protein
MDSRASAYQRFYARLLQITPRRARQQGDFSNFRGAVGLALGRTSYR